MALRLIGPRINKVPQQARDRVVIATADHLGGTLQPRRNTPAAFLLLYAIMAGCTGAEEVTPVRVLSFDVTLDSACTVCATATVELNTPETVTLYVSESGAPPKAWAQMGPDTRMQIPVLQLHAETPYTVHIEVNSIQSEVLPLTTGALPADLPPITLTTSDETYIQSGLTVFPVGGWRGGDPSDVNYLLAVDARGAVVWYRRFDGMTLGLHVDDRNRIYTTDSAQTVVRIDPFGQTSASWVTADAGLDTAHHEIRDAPMDGITFLSTEIRAIDGWTDTDTGETQTYNIVGDRFVTLDAEGAVTWSWSLLDHLDPLSHYTADLHNPFWQNLAPYDALDAVKDWSHGNALVPHLDGWLGSFRNLDWLIQVHKDTGDIDWVLGPEGDFDLAEGGRWFSRQHAPEVQANGTLLLYDNGNDRFDAAKDELPWTRVVEYALDHENQIVTEVWSYAGESPYFCPVVGDINQLANGNRLITDGTVLTGAIDDNGDAIAHFHGRLREIDASIPPNIVWELAIGYADDPKAESYYVYRSVRIDSLYPPEARP